MKKFLVPQKYQIDVLHVLISRINYLFVHMRNGFVVNTKKNAIVENKIAAIGLTFGLDDLDQIEGLKILPSTMIMESHTL